VFRFVTLAFARISKSSLRMCGEWSGLRMTRMAAIGAAIDRG
jgi:hypothetical protein